MISCLKRYLLYAAGLLNWALSPCGGGAGPPGPQVGTRKIPDPSGVPQAVTPLPSPPPHRRESGRNQAWRSHPTLLRTVVRLLIALRSNAESWPGPQGVLYLLQPHLVSPVPQLFLSRAPSLLPQGLCPCRSTSRNAFSLCLICLPPAQPSADIPLLREN